MNAIWTATILAVAIAGYFAWSNQSAPPASKLQIDDCHRLAGEVQALYRSGGAIPDDRTATVRACAVTFGQNWATTGGERAAQLRAEGAARVQ